ncbi:MAG: HAMP domain-containing histidine kinase [Deltaproteobacteria bacterium]|nr:HAMP domain-containing histidine kinase [Deltaproteobacteria bacterium]
MKLRHRLMAALTLVCASVLGVSFVSVYVFIQRDELRALDRSLLAQAYAAADQVRRRGLLAAVGSGHAEVPELVGPTPRFVAIYDIDGTLLATSRDFDAPTLDAAELGIEATQELPAEGVPLDLDDASTEMRGVLVSIDSSRMLLFAASRRAIIEDIGFLGRLLPALFLAALGVTALLARWLGQRLAGDVDAIARVAHTAAQGDLGTRVGGSVDGSTETRALAAALDDMIERLGAVMSAQQHFITHAAHELRSPLATLRGELQLALRRPRDASEYRHALEHILHDVETLGTMAEDLLTLARVTGEGTQPDRDDTAGLAEVIDEAMWMAKGLATASDVRIAVGPLPAVRVRGSVSDLARCVRNLLDNALRYGPPGETVSITATDIGASVELRVCDLGPGVDPLDVDRIFAPFQRGRRTPVSSSAGAGLGLAIAREIARGCGGDLVFELEREVGACVRLTLPCAGPKRAGVARGTAGPVA